MFTAASIRRQIFYGIGDQPFSIRDFLRYGSRAAVDQVFYRLVKAGRIVRVARGVFIKNTAPYPHALTVAKVKAAAFCRAIASHGGRAAHILKMSDDKSFEHTFAASGRTSSFRFGTTTIRFIGTAARKLHLLDAPVGLAIRALWHLGRQACDRYAVSLATWSFGRTDRQLLRQSHHVMPDWMRSCFASLNR
jgi:hypothetical protein